MALSDASLSAADYPRLRTHVYAAIRLPEVEVSKAHALIMRDSIFFRSSYCLLDIGSRNGTFVNGQRLSTNAVRSLFYSAS